jgi:hypothetical protein
MSRTSEDKARFYAILGLLLCGILASNFFAALSALATILPLSNLEEVNHEEAKFSSVLSLSLSDGSIRTSFTPYGGIQAITSLLHPIVVVAVALLLIATIVVLVSHVSPRFTTLRNLKILPLTATRMNILASIIVISCAMISGYLSISSWNNSSWDEVSLFATQVDSVRNGHLNTVPITGPLGHAEASVDTGSIFGAAALSIIFDVEPFAAVHLWSALGVSLLCLFIASVVYIKSRNSKYTILASLAFGPFFVPVIAASAGGFPVAWATFSLVLLFIAAHKTISSQNMVYVSLASLFAFLIRTDYVLAGVTATFVCFLYVEIAKKSRVSRGKWWDSLVPISLFLFIPVVGITLFRIYTYGIAFPSGAIGKSTGLFSDYVSAGIRHLDNVNQETQILIMSVIPIVLISIYTKRIDRLILAAITLPLLLSSTIGGGDWFPSTWARYFMPLFVVIFVASVDYFRIQDQVSSELNRDRHRLIRLPVLSLSIIMVSNLSIAPSAEILENIARPQFSTIEFASSWNQRTSCLAQAGQALDRAFPNNVGIATSEINTLAYFSNQSLTDLQGIVDPRVASQPLRPLEHGITFQKRRLEDIIASDQPGLVYVSEPVCVSDQMNYPADPAWQSPDARTNVNATLSFARGNYSMGRLGEQYRYGSVNYIVSNYQLTQVSWAENSRILVAVRKDLAQQNEGSNYDLDEISSQFISE